MPIVNDNKKKGRKSKRQSASSVAAETQAEETFKGLYSKFDNLPKTTKPVSVRLPFGEIERIERIFKINGMTRPEGIKKAIYKYVAELEKADNH